jgi:uncharacterized protein YihD (DUF1040 family)
MARDPKRIAEVLDLIEAIWKKHPDLRLGQLIFNTCPRQDDLFYLEDDELYKRLCERYPL